MKINELLLAGMSIILCLYCVQEPKETFSLTSPEVYEAIPQGVKTRWISPENPTGEKGKGTGETTRGKVPLAN